MCSQSPQPQIAGNQASPPQTPWRPWCEHQAECSACSYTTANHYPKVSFGKTAASDTDILFFSPFISYRALHSIFCLSWWGPGSINYLLPPGSSITPSPLAPTLTLPVHTHKSLLPRREEMGTWPDSVAPSKHSLVSPFHADAVSPSTPCHLLSLCRVIVFFHLNSAYPSLISLCRCPHLQAIQTEKG